MQSLLFLYAVMFCSLPAQAVIPLSLERDHRPSDTLVVPVSLANQHPIIFEDSGNVVVTSAFIHVLVPVNLSVIENAMHTLEVALKKAAPRLDMSEALHPPMVSPLKTLANLSSLTLMDKFAVIRMDFARVKRLLPHPEGFASDSLDHERLDHHRSKRIPILPLALIPNAVGTFWGFFAKHAIKALTNSVMRTDLGVLLHKGRDDIAANLLQRLLDVLFNRTPYYAYDVKTRDKLESYIYLNTALDVLAYSVQKLTNAVQQLSNHRLAVDLLSEAQMATIQATVIRYAKSIQVFPLISNKADYYQIDTSYIRDGNDVTAVLHIPCARESQLLSLLKYVPSPIPLPASSRMTAPLKAILHQSDFVHDQSAVNETFLEALFFVPEADFIAVSSRGYKLLSQADLAKCVHRNHIYICSGPTFTWVDFSKSCLGSLYNKDEAGAMRHCSVDRRPFQELVYQTGTRSYIVFSPEQFTARISCISDSRTANIPVTSRITLPPSCNLALRDHSLDADEQFQVQTLPEISAWDWRPLDMPASRLEDPTHIEERLRHLMGNSSFKSRIDKHFGSDFLPDGSPLEGVIIFLMAVASAACAYALTCTSLNTRTFILTKWNAWIQSLANRPDPQVPPPRGYETETFRFQPSRPPTPDSDGSPAPLRNTATLPKPSRRTRHHALNQSMANIRTQPAVSVHRMTSASQSDLHGHQLLPATAPLYRPPQASNYP